MESCDCVRKCSLRKAANSRAEGPAVVPPASSAAAAASPTGRSLNTSLHRTAAQRQGSPPNVSGDQHIKKQTGRRHRLCPPKCRGQKKVRKPTHWH